MSDTTEVVFNVQLLKKDGAIALAKACNLRRDWMRLKLDEIRAMLRAFPAQRLIEAAKSSDYFDADDIETLTDADLIDDEGLDDEAEGESAPAPADEPPADEPPAAKPNRFADIPFKPGVPAPSMATSQAAAATSTAGKAPDVTQVAALLAQLLATGKAGLDADEVRNIVMPMLIEQTGMLKGAMESELSKTSTALLETVNGWITEAVKTATDSIPPRTIRIEQPERESIEIEGLQHHKFEALLRACSARKADGNRVNVWMYGPPGTGKTTAAANVAKALDMPFYCTGALLSKYDITGFVDAGGKLVRTPFREAWENGGVYLFDEIDGSDPRAVVAFNAALANGVMAFPDGMVKRHADCVVIAAANTAGHGATAEFVGRMKMDAASTDRFIFISWPVDEKIESALCRHPSWAKVVQAFRRKVAEKGVKGVMVTPRATEHGSSLLDAGLDLETVKEMVLRKGMSDEQWTACAV